MPIDEAAIGAAPPTSESAQEAQIVTFASGGAANDGSPNGEIGFHASHHTFYVEKPPLALAGKNGLKR
jgi:hypothetical protein